MKIIPGNWRKEEWECRKLNIIEPVVEGKYLTRYVPEAHFVRNFFRCQFFWMSICSFLGLMQLFCQTVILWILLGPGKNGQDWMEIGYQTLNESQIFPCANSQESPLEIGKNIFYLLLHDIVRALFEKQELLCSKKRRISTF